MPYTIARYNGSVLTTIPDGTVNTTASSLNLPGKNYAGYGLPVDEDLVYLLENFAGPNVPANPLQGQMWFNTTDSEMYFCPTDGESNSAQWIRMVSSGGNGGNGNTVVSGTLTLSGNIPAISTTTGTMQILGIGGAGIGGNVYAGGGVYATYLVGDGGNIANINGANVSGTTANAYHANIADYASNPYGSTWQVYSASNAAPSGTVANVCVTYNGPGGDNTVVSLLNGNTGKGLYDSRGVSILYTTGSATGWTLNVNNATVSGTTTTSILTATGSATVGSLGVVGAASVGTNLTVSGAASVAGTLTAASVQAGTIGSTGQATLDSLVVNGASTIHSLVVNGSETINGDLGVTGSATVNGAVNTGTVNTTNLNAPGTAALGSITRAAGGAGVVSGAWVLQGGSTWQATYADLAERYSADAEYEVGTVLEIGGTAEVTAVKLDLSEDVFGVVSNSYAYLLNCEGNGNEALSPAVAVIGRVVVKVTGSVKKGDRLVSAGNGIARVAKAGEATSKNTIGRALEDKASEDIGLVLSSVLISM